MINAKTIKHKFHHQLLSHLHQILGRLAKRIKMKIMINKRNPEKRIDSEQSMLKEQ